MNIKSILTVPFAFLGAISGSTITPGTNNNTLKLTTLPDTLPVLYDLPKLDTSPTEIVTSKVSLPLIQVQNFSVTSPCQNLNNKYIEIAAEAGALALAGAGALAVTLAAGAAIAAGATEGAIAGLTLGLRTAGALGAGAAGALIGAGIVVGAGRLAGTTGALAGAGIVIAVRIVLEERAAVANRAVADRAAARVADRAAAIIARLAERVAAIDIIKRAIRNFQSEKSYSKHAEKILAPGISIATKDTAGKICGICTEQFPQRAPIWSDKNGHVFHPPCMRAWVITNISQHKTPTCPMCREEI